MSSTSAGAGVSASATSLLAPVGLGVGGIFVAAALIYLLTYFELVSVADRNVTEVRQTLIVTIVPLIAVFGGIIVFHTLQTV